MNLCRIVRRRNRILLLTLLPLAIGCNSIEKDHQSNFLKPFASTESTGAKAASQPMPSERALCIETAKTVAAKGHAEEAIKLFERAEELDPTATALDADLAPLYAEVGDHDSAIERYKLCVQRTPDDAELINNYAWTLMEAGRFEQAIAEAASGVQIFPEDTRLKSTLAMVHYRNGDHAKSFQQWELAVGKTAAHHNLALLDFDAGNVDSAREHLRQAKQDPELNSRANALIATLEKSSKKL